jgi:hypothetical protein
MGFRIPKEVMSSITAAAPLPGTGYYKVAITKLEDRKKLDRQGNHSYFIHIRFEGGGTTREIFSMPYNKDGELAPALKAMDEEVQRGKIVGMLKPIKGIAKSAGITDEYMDENDFESDWLEGRDAYIAWLGRPTDTPQGVRAYGAVKAWLLKEVAEKKIADGEILQDTRNFPWRTQQQSTGPSNGMSSTPSARPSGRPSLPPPPRR